MKTQWDGYMASPYSTGKVDDPALRHFRFMEAVMAAGWAHQQRLFLYSPIAHTHPIAEHCRLPTGFDYWQEYDMVGVLSCRDFYILAIPGYIYSRGIYRELKIAMEHNAMVKCHKANGWEDPGYAKKLYFINKEASGRYSIGQADFDNVEAFMQNAQKEA